MSQSAWQAGPGSLGRPAHRPLSVKEISEEAEKFAWNPNIPLKYWAGALEALYREGRNYLYEGNYAKAYLLLLRYSSLYLGHVVKHPETKTPEGRRLLKPIQDRIPGVFDQLEEIKPYLNDAHREWELMAEAGARTGQGSPQWTASRYDAYAKRDAALSWNSHVKARLIDATENQDLAVDLAQKELRRRDAARRATRQAGISEEEEQKRRSAGVWDDWDRSALSRPLVAEDEDLRRQMEAARRRLDYAGGRDSGGMDGDPESQMPAPVTYAYPSIHKSTPLHYESSTAMRRPHREDREPLPLPSRPPKETLYHAPSARYGHPPPPPPQKETARLLPAAAISMDAPPPPPPPKTTMEPPPQKERYTFRPAGYLENGDPIRPVFLPENLRRDFLKLAAENTRRGLEMCGLLCGTSVNNALFITRLLIPEQRCTPDTCETTNEAATFDYMDKEDLIQLGWIHTHPTQTCFMSSRDLHTQAGYQIMMPESIAIVVAPKHDPSWGVFRLTNPPGLPHLLKCERTGTFHEHSIPSDELYTEAENPPGHVYVSARMPYEVYDLRSNDY